MQIEKKVLAQLEKCYAVAPLTYHGESCFLVAAEKHERCLLFSAQGALLDTVWHGPGGVMTMEHVPDTDGAFLATHEFYSPNDSQNAKIVLAYPTQHGWQIKTLANLPFVHRFTIVSTNHGRYVVAATLKSAHAFKDDWTCPGRIWAAPLPDNDVLLRDAPPLQFTAIQSGLFKNHGFFKYQEGTDTHLLFGAQNGVFHVTPPASAQDAWAVECILDKPTSDMALIDLDGDGERELVTYSPFHGEALTIYKKDSTGYTAVYTHAEPLAFLHAICAGTLQNKAVMVLGHRAGARNLCLLQYQNGYTLTVIDSDIGPANAMLLHANGNEAIVCANRETDEIALYQVL